MFELGKWRGPEVIEAEKPWDFRRENLPDREEDGLFNGFLKLESLIGRCDRTDFFDSGFACLACL